MESRRVMGILHKHAFNKRGVREGTDGNSLSDASKQGPIVYLIHCLSALSLPINYGASLPRVQPLASIPPHTPTRWSSASHSHPSLTRPTLSSLSSPSSASSSPSLLYHGIYRHGTPEPAFTCFGHLSRLWWNSWTPLFGMAPSGTSLLYGVISVRV